MIFEDFFKSGNLGIYKTLLIYIDDADPLPKIKSSF